MLYYNISARNAWTEIWKSEKISLIYSGGSSAMHVYSKNGYISINVFWEHVLSVNNYVTYIYII